ncbi:MAG: protein kinase [Hyphomicrobiales bacterium]|nr:protein kinase [Hyphomicrobiales bacterium]OQW82891.1 MAG: serine/threonine protein kinase [Proteobacteria bacterium ST_bin15]
MPGRLAAGMVIDGFTLVAPLHRGGMAELWIVDTPNETMPLAMKIPFVHEGDDPTAIVGFEMEQMILPRLSGPHVPRYVASGEIEGKPYLVMERIDGTSLRPLMDEGPQRGEEVAALGAKVARALHALHLQHVIHFDIKPSNVMLRSSGEACLIDFGLSRHLHLPDLLSEEFRLPLGTGPYISPEQVLRQRNDPRSDQFALGVMLYVLATGHRPFGKPESLSALRKRIWRQPIPPRALNPDIQPWLQEIILRCLEVDPAMRYPSASQLSFALEHPDQTVLTERAHRLTRGNLMTAFKSWLRSIGQEAGDVTQALTPASAPIILVCVHLKAQSSLLQAVHHTVTRLIASQAHMRLACLTVQKIRAVGIDSTLDAEGRNIHLHHLAELRHWAGDLAKAADQVTFHVIEASDPAAAVIDFARHNAVDQIVIGARSSSAIRRFLGSVSSRVVAEAPCTVTVVRARGEASIDA